MCAEVKRQIFCWGFNLDGECGQDCSLAINYSVLTPTAVQFPPNFPVDANRMNLAAGKLHACLLVADPSTPLWCWGANGSGQLGNPLSTPDSGTTCPSSTVIQALASDASVPTVSGDMSSLSFSPLPVQGIANYGLIAGISMGWAHTCARTVEGKAVCWGNNNRGQLGNGVDLSTLGSCVQAENCPVINPSYVVDETGPQLTAVNMITAGAGPHVCVKNATAVKCWGGNDVGELGTGEPSVHSYSKAQATIFPNTTRKIATGEDHTCIVDVPAAPAKPDILCVGDAKLGQTGRGPDDNSATWELKPVKWK
jgi:alpha-tubulin suppressor-like RCC1 family protein